MEINLRGGLAGMPQVPPQLPTLLFVAGAAAAGFGMLLLWNEWLLRYLVASVFLLVGGVLLLTAWRAKKMLG